MNNNSISKELQKSIGFLLVEFSRYIKDSENKNLNTSIIFTQEADNVCVNIETENGKIYSNFLKL